VFRHAAALTLAAIVLATAPVAAVTSVTIQSQAGGFQPASVNAVLGEVVDWDNNDGEDHTTSQRRTLALWSRRMDPGDSFQFTMRQAGTFPYLCTIHPDMTGKVRVPMTASLDTVGVGEKVVFRVATSTAPSGFRYEIARRRSGGAWKAWKSITSKTTSWRPKANAVGGWDFRARTVRISNGGKSAWSPVLDLDVVS
jgi:plastocyanin